MISPYTFFSLSFGTSTSMNGERWKGGEYIEYIGAVLRLSARGNSFRSVVFAGLVCISGVARKFSSLNILITYIATLTCAVYTCTGVNMMELMD